MADLDLLPTKLLALLVRPDFWLWLGLVTAMGALLAGWRRLAGWVLASIVAAVTLVGFGTFKAAKRAARTGVNPKTGEKLKIAATTVPRFTAGAGFKAAVAGKKKAAKK